MKKILKKPLSLKLRALREERGLAVAQLAALVGITRQGLGRIERGEVDPLWRTLQALARCLDVSTEDLRDSTN